MKKADRKVPVRFCMFEKKSKLYAAGCVTINNIVCLALLRLNIDVKALNVLAAVCLLSHGYNLVLSVSLVSELKLNFSTNLACCHDFFLPF